VDRNESSSSSKKTARLLLGVRDEVCLRPKKSTEKCAKKVLNLWLTRLPENEGAENYPTGASSKINATDSGYS
jgi:hypothetical protein